MVVAERFSLMKGVPEGALFRGKKPQVGGPGAGYQGGANDRALRPPILVDAEKKQDEDQEQQENKHHITAPRNALSLNFRHENTSFGLEVRSPLVWVVSRFIICRSVL